MKSNYYEQSHELRLIVLMETDDHKGFRQVLVTAEQFKNISDNTGIKIPKEEHGEDLKDDMELFETRFNDDLLLDADLFIGCESTI
jgi:hypothetical protein